MFRYPLSLLAGLLLIISAPLGAQQVNLEELRDQVADTERAFAASMKNRDHQAFMSFLSSEAIFFSGDTPQRGKQQVADAWKSLFEDSAAPFSWEPETVEVLDSGKLALSSGPVRNEEGKTFAIYTSIWRLEAPGEWRIIFDKGNRFCEPPAGEG